MPRTQWRACRPQKTEKPLGDGEITASKVFQCFLYNADL